MSQVIVYKQDGGVIAVIHPTPESLAEHGIEAIALKDVPEGKPFKIIDAEDLPSDRSGRHLWTVDDEALDDGVGAPWTAFPSETDDHYALKDDALPQKDISPGRLTISLLDMDPAKDAG